MEKLMITNTCWTCLHFNGFDLCQKLNREMEDQNIPEDCPLPGVDILERVQKLEEYFAIHIHDCHRTTRENC